MQDNTSQNLLHELLTIWEKGLLDPWVVLEIIWVSMGDGSITGREISGEAGRYAKLWRHLEESDRLSSTSRSGVETRRKRRSEPARFGPVSADPPTTSTDQSDSPDWFADARQRWSE